MSPEGESSSYRRAEPRVPFEGAVRLRYRLFHEFLEENAANISSGGMFIRTIHPGEVGSELEFEVRLEDDFTLIQGRGEVVWVRRPGEDPNAEPGMGIHFVELEGDSRALVERIVDERVKAGLELFSLESDAPVAEATSAARPAATAPAGAADDPIWELDPGAGRAPPAAAAAPGWSGATAARRSSPVRLIAVAVISALVGAGAVLTFYWLYVQPSIDALETRIDELAGSPGGPWRPPEDEPDSMAAAGEAAAGEPPAAISRAGQSAEIVAALRGWAAAWSEQRIDDYLAYYATGFEPPDGLDRPAWEAARRARIERPRWIRVALTLVRVEATGPDSAEAAFVQSYRSERYNDLVRKRLSMVRQDGGWKIAAERSSS